MELWPQSYWIPLVFIRMPIAIDIWTKRVLDFTNILLAKWAQIPRNTLQSLVKELPRRLKAVIATKRDYFNMNAQGFGMRCSTGSDRCDGQLFTNFCTYSVSQMQCVGSYCWSPLKMLVVWLSCWCKGSIALWVIDPKPVFRLWIYSLTSWDAQLLPVSDLETVKSKKQHDSQATRVFRKRSVVVTLAFPPAQVSSNSTDHLKFSCGHGSHEMRSSLKYFSQ